MELRNGWKGFFRSMTAHPIGFVGVTIVTSTTVLFFVFFGLEMLGAFEGPYGGIFTFLVLPALIVLGLVLIPIGRFLRSRLEKRGLVVDLSMKEQQQRLIIFLILTGANVAILFMAAYHGVHFTDSNSFCGEVCHEVMEPEFAAYQNSPHSRVQCVSCHIGPGADFFVRYKVNGIRQVFAVIFDTFQRPISAPVHNLRPARETCEQCHWPEKFHGDKFLVKTKYEEDEENTELKTVMVLKVGGGGAESGYPTGIHWHTHSGNKVSYIAVDDKREDIVWVEVERENGEKTVYTRGGETFPDSVLEAGERRLMDCIDCHNRPTHTYELPGETIDLEMLVGGIDRSLPSVKAVGLELLNGEYPSKEEALEAIPARLDDYYRENHLDRHADFAASIEKSSETLKNIYQRNIFPAMNITWNTYPNHIGHRDDGGCFRCHAGDHLSEDGLEIDSDCETCHSILAWDEEDPAILNHLVVD